MLKLAVAGCHGRMGKALVQAISETEGMVLSGTTTSSDLPESLKEFDVLIDFTTPAATLSHVALCLARGKKMVIGTTGLNEAQKKLLQEASKDIPIVFAPNMSLGMNTCFQLLKQAALALGNEADIEILEAHHRHKVDAPSGTALKMGEVISHALHRDLAEVATYTRHGKIGERAKESIGFSTLRGGDVMGEQTVFFFLDGERIEITHRASSRRPYALGALQAAKWLAHKTKGLYGMEEIFS